MGDLRNDRDAHQPTRRETVPPRHLYVEMARAHLPSVAISKRIGINTSGGNQTKSALTVEPDRHLGAGQ